MFIGFGGLLLLLECGVESIESGAPLGVDSQRTTAPLGTCGNGNRGDGICFDGSCCSQYGFCGSSFEHCSGRSLADSDNLFDIKDDIQADIKDSFDDEDIDGICQALKVTSYAFMGIVVAVMAIQGLCSIYYLVRGIVLQQSRKIKSEHTKQTVMIMVPCYNEGDKELRKTIDSIMDTSYPDSNKVLVVVADGDITGKGETKSTPEVISSILQYHRSPQDTTYDCTSVGPDERSHNRAKVYYGTKKSDKNPGKMLHYIVIEKCGIPVEKGSPKAGNRGKRDSQLLITGLLNKVGCHPDDPLNGLETTIVHALADLQLGPMNNIKYLLAIDADTEISEDSITQMCYNMEEQPFVLALCGETRVANPSDSWVTRIQVFEYYTNHHLKKAFESVFNTVTCLPGCFTMYRLFDYENEPLLACDSVYIPYAINDAEINSLHAKNLYHLGEDRMLTTLLLRHFPEMNLSFVPEATCQTVVPDTFSVLLSQRRRWVNSTFHNLLELWKVKTCGMCCFSMKVIILLDLVGTLVLPVAFIYVGIMLYFALNGNGDTLPQIILGFSVAVQLVVPALRLHCNILLWSIPFYVVGVPIFYFILPIYAFWHMDDVSWGSTRLVAT